MGETTEAKEQVTGDGKGDTVLKAVCVWMNEPKVTEFMLLGRGKGAVVLVNVEDAKTIEVRGPRSDWPDLVIEAWKQYRDAQEQ